MSNTAESSAAAQLEANKAVIRSFVDAWNTRDFGRFQSLIGQDEDRRRHRTLRPGVR